MSRREGVDNDSAKACYGLPFGEELDRDVRNRFGTWMGTAMRLVAAFAAGILVATLVAVLVWRYVDFLPNRTVPGKSAHATTGLWILRAEPDVATFLDSGRIVNHGTERSAWIYRVWRRPQPWIGKTYYTVKLLQRWDCAGRRSRLEDAGAFDRDFVRIDEADPTDEKWKSVFPDSTQEVALDIVCIGTSAKRPPKLAETSFAVVAKTFWADPRRYAYAP